MCVCVATHLVIVLHQGLVRIDQILLAGRRLDFVHDVLGSEESLERRKEETEDQMGCVVSFVPLGYITKRCGQGGRVTCR